MRRFWITTFWITVAILCSATVGQAENPAGTSLNSVGRWLGYGWSRGYHTNDNRPPMMPSDYPHGYEYRHEVETSLSPEPANSLQLQPATPSVIAPTNPKPGSQPLPPPVPSIKTPPLPFKSRSNSPTVPAVEEAEQKGNMSRRVRSYFHRAERYPLNQVR